MAYRNPFPLFPGYSELQEFAFSEYPALKLSLEITSDSASDVVLQWNWTQGFLLFIGRNKSEHTYIRFRTEVEKFLLWAMLVKKQSIIELRKTDILDYADFCWKPPTNWIGTATKNRFVLKQGNFTSNKNWRPFKIQAAKHQRNKEVDKKEYRPSQETLSATFTALVAFYKYLMDEELSLGNPAQLAKKDCRHFIKDARVAPVRRLSPEQWEYLLDAATSMADVDATHERHLFLIAALKTLFLRISELSERTNWSPQMGHFYEDSDGNWWLQVFGKGRKLRDVTVPPDFIPFIERYRTSRNLSPLPTEGEKTVLLEKIRGQGGMTARHLSRLVQEVFDAAYEKMKDERGAKEARKLKEASTHYLRHTGASMEIERGRPLKYLSEDLGHASMATTDTIYVQTDKKNRAESGKNRKVN